MQVEWIKGLSAKDADDLKKTLHNNKFLLDKLKEIVYSRRMQLQNVRMGDYDSPSWSHKQAHYNGKIEALDDIIKLLSL